MCDLSNILTSLCENVITYSIESIEQSQSMCNPKFAIQARGRCEFCLMSECLLDLNTMTGFVNLLYDVL